MLVKGRSRRNFKSWVLALMASPSAEYVLPKAVIRCRICRRGNKIRQLRQRKLSIDPMAQVKQVQQVFRRLPGAYGWRAQMAAWGLLASRVRS